MVEINSNSVNTAEQTTTQTASSLPNDVTSSNRASTSSSNLCFAMRPTASGFAEKSSWGFPMQLKGNNYRLQMKGDFKVRKYSMCFTPEIPDNSKVIRYVTKACREQIKEQFGTYCLHGINLYSLKLHMDAVSIVAEYDGQNYTLELKYAKCVNDDELEYAAFQSIIFKAILGRMTFERDGRNMFNPSKAVPIQQLQVWPGFFSSMQKLA